MGAKPEKPRRKSRVRRLLLWVLVLGALWLLRGTILSAIGGFLVVSDPVEKADAALVLSGGLAERVAEAVDRYKEGQVSKIVLMTPEAEPAAALLLSRGVRLPTEPEIARAVAVGLGVPDADVLVVPDPVDSSESEALAFRLWVGKRGWKRVLVVTSPYHTRRARGLYRDVLEKIGVEALVVPSRHGSFRAEDWWRHRAGIRNLVIEYQKLIYYSLPGHDR